MEHSPIVSESLDRVGVIGAGQMGSGIAGLLIHAGIPTTLVDVNPIVLARAAERIGWNSARSWEVTSADGCDPGVACAPLGVSTEISSLRDASLIIEAVIEDLATKQTVFRSLPAELPETVILASNTSTIPILQLSEAVRQPARFAGLHFFHPVHRMMLVEVIRGPRTSPETISQLVHLGRRLGKTPIVVRDGAGFFTTRVLSPYLDQALQLAEAGVSIEEIDAAARGFGMPTGPIALLDLIGLDTALAIARVMAGAFPDRFRVSPLLEQLVQAGTLGRKTGQGLRSHVAETEAMLPVACPPPSGQPGGELPRPRTHEELCDRLFLPMLLEAVRTLDEGIIASPRDVDLGVILGLGFPASRGGILRWCDREGPAAILERVSRLRDLGPAFEPPASLVRMATSNEVFHPDG